MIRQVWELTKLSAAMSLRYTGLLSLIGKTKMRNRTLVLMYHRVVDDERAALINSSAGIVVSEKTFDMQMNALRRYFNLISLDDLHQHLKQGSALPERSCLLTFDDGWLDNYEVALPILQKYGIPATIFLPVDYISNDSIFWQEELQMHLSRLLSSGRSQDLERLRRIIRSDKATSELRVADIQDFAIHLKSYSEAEIDNRLEEIRREIPLADEYVHYNRYLSWEQVAEMNAAGLSFASHAMSHRRLCQLSDEQCRNELVASRAILEERLEETVRAIAYPNGDFDERVVNEAVAAGYTMGFTTKGGFFESGIDPLAIPRINIHDNNARTEARFLCTCLDIF